MSIDVRLKRLEEIRKILVEFLQDKGISVSDNATLSDISVYFKNGDIPINPPSNPDEPNPPINPTELTLVVKFLNDKMGDSGADIVLVGTEDDMGAYELCYADNNGILNNYVPITSQPFELDDNFKLSYCHLVEDNAIPSGATKLVAVKDGEICATYNLPQNKITSNLGEKRYSFGILSDTHIMRSRAYLDEKMPNVLSYMNDTVDFICHCGDLSDNGQKVQFDKAKEYKDTYFSTKPWYLVTGNHDYKDSSFDYLANLSTYGDGVSDNPECYKVEHGNDIFIHISASAESPTFSESTVNLLTEWVELYKNKRLFVFCHYPFNVGTCGGILAATGGITKTTPIIKVLRTHHNVIMFGGHIHSTPFYQEENYDHNIYNLDGLRGIYVPSVINIEEPNVTDTTKAMCRIVDVYDNYAILKTYDIKEQKYVPIGEFIINTSETPKARIDREYYNCVGNDRLLNHSIGEDYSFEIVPNKNMKLSYILQYDDSQCNYEITEENNRITVKNLGEAQRLYIGCDDLENREPIIACQGQISSSGEITYGSTPLLTQLFEFDENYTYHLYVPSKADKENLQQTFTFAQCFYEEGKIFEKRRSTSQNNSSSAIDIDITPYTSASKYFRLQINCNLESAMKDGFKEVQLLKIPK